MATFMRSLDKQQLDSAGISRRVYPKRCDRAQYRESSSIGGDLGETYGARATLMESEHVLVCGAPAGMIASSYFDQAAISMAFSASLKSSKDIRGTIRTEYDGSRGGDLLMLKERLL